MKKKRLYLKIFDLFSHDPDSILVSKKKRKNSEYKS